jgi:hypothetical protein
LSKAVSLGRPMNNNAIMPGQKLKIRCRSFQKLMVFICPRGWQTQCRTPKVNKTMVYAAFDASYLLPAPPSKKRGHEMMVHAASRESNILFTLTPDCQRLSKNTWSRNDGIRSSSRTKHRSTRLANSMSTPEVNKTMVYAACGVFY